MNENYQKLLAKIIVGSQMFGTNTPESDVDIAEIYKCDNDDLLGLTYKEHDDLNKDYRRYEIGKVIKMLMEANPNILEMLNAPDDCLLETSEEWEYLRSIKDTFLTKNIGKTFIGYAKSQIKKADSLNKKMNWEKNRVAHKDILDFCYIVEDAKSIPFKKWIKFKSYELKFFGVAKIPHNDNLYALYYDNHSHMIHSDIIPTELKLIYNEQAEKQNIKSFGYKGLVKVDEEKNDVVSNQLRLSSIPKDEQPIATLIYNKDAYTTHCKDYREYQTWLQNRNEIRYRTNKEHGQIIDGKNLAHNVRLLMTVKEALLGNGLKVRRNKNEIEYLLKIKHGELDLKQIKLDTENEIKIVEDLMKKSNLPEKKDLLFYHDILIKLRKI